MQKRYIDADKFIEYLGFENTEEERDENVGEAVTLEDFDNQITEDVQEIKHGKWECLESEIGLYSCSECGHNILRAKCNFCPNCGAKMDKE